MKAEHQSGFIAFRPRARLLKLIGAELISDDVVAVTELVKNAHDADATHVTIRFENVTSEGGRIVVSDDGHGMDRETLLGGWMEPAGSTKRGENRKLSPKGRWMLGEKGLGRFAADKLGSQLELVSRRTGSAAEVCASFDWDKFDNDSAMLGDVKNRWELRPAREIAKAGTILTIGGLRAPWTERMFRRLSMRLSRLRSPFQTRNRFSIRIESDEFPEYSRELGSGFLEQAPYSVDAQFDGGGTLKVSLNGATADVIEWSGPPLSCGSLRVRLHAFDLETEALARLGPRTEVRAWLKEWCGISMYRDDFRVWPYGEPHDDWLRLDQRRVNNPVVCLSNNQIVGFVEISQKKNPELRDQTNREGLIHNQALDDLRRLMHFVLQLLESERQSIRHPEGREKRREITVTVTNEGESDLLKLRGLSEKVGGKLGNEIRGAAGRIEEERQRSEVDRRRMIDSYAHLAARGQAMSGLGSGATEMLNRIKTAAHGIRKGLGKVTEHSAQIMNLEESVRLLEARLSLMSSLSEGHGARRRTIEIPVEVRSSFELFDHVLKAAGIKVRLNLDEGRLLRADMAPEALRLLLHLLVENAMDWLKGVKEPVITVTVRGSDSAAEIIVADNGPGLAPAAVQRAFEPMFSLKEGGNGMGLTIARNIIAAHQGTLEASQDGRRKGASFRIVVPLKRARATRDTARA